MYMSLAPLSQYGEPGASVVVVGVTVYIHSLVTPLVSLPSTYM